MKTRIEEFAYRINEGDSPLHDLCFDIRRDQLFPRGEDGFDEDDQIVYLTEKIANSPHIAEAVDTLYEIIDTEELVELYEMMRGGSDVDGHPSGEYLGDGMYLDSEGNISSGE